MLGAIMFFLIWAPLNVFRRLFWNWTVEGLENLPPREQGFILASNHMHWLDIIAIGVSLPLNYRPRWLGKIELFKQPVVGWWFKEMGVIPIRRGSRDLSALRDAETALREGTVLIVFPEGTRSKTGGLIEGRGGVVRMAVNSGAPIVPVAIWGTEVGLGGLFRRKPLVVSFLRPYHPDIVGPTIPADKMQQLTTEMMLYIAERLPVQYRGVYREQQDERERRQSVGAPE